MKKPKLLIIFELMLFLEMLSGAYPWFFWNINTNYLYVLFAIIALLYLKANRLKLKITSNIGVGFIILFLGTLISVDSQTINEKIYRICCFIPILAIASDTNNCRNIFETIAKWFAIILVPSMLLHVLFLIIGFPPSLIIINPIVPDNYIYFNYFILVKNIIMSDYELRFCSIFLEPGYLGTLLSFLLYIGKFDFKKFYNIVFLLALVLTLSLAGYVIAGIAWIFIKFQEGKSLKRLAQVAMVFSAIYFGGTYYNGGNNILNNNIISRLQYDQDTGIAGNNRTSHMADDYFENLTNSGEILTGIGAKRVRQINGGGTKGADFNDQIRGAGYKIFFITNGIIQAVIILLGYLFFIGNTDVKYGIGFLLLIIITFIQAAYPLSTSWLIPFVFGCVLNLRSNENRNINIS